MASKLQYIQIQGFKSIHYEKLEIRDLNVLIGPNGAGKSNFIAVFRFLRQMVERRLQVSVREAGGAEKLLHYGNKETSNIHLELGFPPNFYSVNLLPSADDGMFIEEEQTGFRGDGYAKPIWQLIGEGNNESVLRDAAKLGGIPRYVYDVLKNWRVYHFHDTSESAGVKKTNRLNDNLYLREDASNLAAFLYRMQNENPKHFERIEKTVQLVVPMFQEFLLRPDPNNTDTIRLEWFSKDSDYVFGASAFSDGSLRFICLCTLLLQPQRADLILLDEPELGLHPLAVEILGGLIRKASNFSQLIISTQSIDLVSAFEPEDIVVVEHRDGETVFQRQEEAKLTEWLKNYSLGELWEKNILGGRP